VYYIPMATARLETRGRPRYIADIEYKDDPAQFYYDKFYKACHPLSYREMLALARHLGFDLRTIYRWRSGESFPRNISTVLTVLDWVRIGKPIKQQTQREIQKANAMW
jgi:hypothetical protein